MLNEGSFPSAPSFDAVADPYGRTFMPNSWPGSSAGFQMEEPDGFQPRPPSLKRPAGGHWDSDLPMSPSVPGPGAFAGSGPGGPGSWAIPTPVKKERRMEEAVGWDIGTYSLPDLPHDQLASSAPPTAWGPPPAPAPPYAYAPCPPPSHFTGQPQPPPMPPPVPSVPPQAWPWPGHFNMQPEPSYGYGLDPGFGPGGNPVDFQASFRGPGGFAPGGLALPQGQPPPPPPLRKPAFHPAPRPPAPPPPPSQPNPKAWSVPSVPSGIVASQVRTQSLEQAAAGPLKLSRAGGAPPPPPGGPPPPAPAAGPAKAQAPQVPPATAAEPARASDSNSVLPMRLEPDQGPESGPEAAPASAAPPPAVSSCPDSPFPGPKGNPGPGSKDPPPRPLPSSPKRRSQGLSWADPNKDFAAWASGVIRGELSKYKAAETGPGGGGLSEATLAQLERDALQKILEKERTAYSERARGGGAQHASSHLQASKIEPKIADFVSKMAQHRARGGAGK